MQYHNDPFVHAVELLKAEIYGKSGQNPVRQNAMAIASQNNWDNDNVRAMAQQIIDLAAYKAYQNGQAPDNFAPYMPAAAEDVANYHTAAMTNANPQLLHHLDQQTHAAVVAARNDFQNFTAELDHFVQTMSRPPAPQQGYGMPPANRYGGQQQYGQRPMANNRMPFQPQAQPPQQRWGNRGAPTMGHDVQVGVSASRQPTLAEQGMAPTSSGGWRRRSGSSTAPSQEAAHGIVESSSRDSYRPAQQQPQQSYPVKQEKTDMEVTFETRARAMLEATFGPKYEDNVILWHTGEDGNKLPIVTGTFAYDVNGDPVIGERTEERPYHMAYNPDDQVLALTISLNGQWTEFVTDKRAGLDMDYSDHKLFGTPKRTEQDGYYVNWSAIAGKGDSEAIQNVTDGVFEPTTSTPREIRAAFVADNPEFFDPTDGSVTVPLELTNLNLMTDVAFMPYLKEVEGLGDMDFGEVTAAIRSDASRWSLARLVSVIQALDIPNCIYEETFAPHARQVLEDALNIEFNIPWTIDDFEEDAVILRDEITKEYGIAAGDAWEKLEPELCRRIWVFTTGGETGDFCKSILNRRSLVDMSAEARPGDVTKKFKADCLEHGITTLAKRTAKVLLNVPMRGLRIYMAEGVVAGSLNRKNQPEVFEALDALLTRVGNGVCELDLVTTDGIEVFVRRAPLIGDTILIGRK